jgi:pantothenate kinase-related protein Tda10
MEGTRVAILGDLAWTMEADAPPIYWLSGMAGTGKSAIALALSRLLDANGLLGGSFFCSRPRSPELRDTR